MAKKLNIVLRDPVKLHKNESTAPELPSPFDNQEKVKNKNKTKQENKSKKGIEKSTNEISKRVSAKVTKSSNPKSSAKDINYDQKDYRDQMSLRVRQVWEYFCEIATADDDLKNSFEVTRSEVMEKAGIGSTNTYRNALKKFEELELLEIELRPGVINGSLFHLTEVGLAQAKLSGKNE